MPTLIEVTALPDNTYKVSLSFTDADGAPVTPNVPLVWSLTDEAGTIINGRSGIAITPPAETVNIVLFNADLASLGADDTGMRKFSVLGDYGSNNYTLDQSFLFPIDVLPLPLAMIKKQCNIIPENQDDDALLQLFARAVIDHGQSLANRKFIQTQSTLELDRFPVGTWENGRIDLAAGLQSVTSIAYVDDNGAAQTVDVADYEVRTSPLVGCVRPIYDGTWPSDARNAVVITYQSGWPVGTIPKPVQAWMLYRIASMYEQRESFVIGAAVNEMPHDFMDCLLDPYKIPVVA